MLTAFFYNLIHCSRAESPPLELTLDGLYFECRTSVKDHLVFGSLPPTAVPTYTRPGRGEVLGSSTHRPRRHDSRHEECTVSTSKSAPGSDRSVSRYYDNSTEATAMRDRRRQRVQLSLDPKRLRRQAQASEPPTARPKSDDNMSLIPVGPVVLGGNDSSSSGSGEGGGMPSSTGPVLRSDFEGAEELLVARTLAFNLEVRNGCC